MTARNILGSEKPLEALPRLDLATLAAQEPVPAIMAIEGAAPLGEHTLLNGAPGVGKSLFAVTAAVAIAAGLGSVLGLKVIAAPVVLYNCEEPVRQLHWILHHACKRLGVGLADLAERLHIVNRRGELDNHFGTFAQDGAFIPSITWRRLMTTCEETEAKVLFVDNIAHVFVGNENDRLEVTRAMAVVAADAERRQVAIISLAHPSKNGADYSGSTAWLASVRSQFVIERPKDEEDRDVRVLRSAKFNYGATGELARFRWHDHAFVRDEDLPPGVAAEIAEVARCTGANEAFLRCLAKVTEEGRNVSHAGAANYAPKVFARMPIGKGYSLEEYEAAMERLLHKGTILAGQRVGTYDNRSPKLGIKLADETAQSGAQRAHNQAHNQCSKGARSPHNHAHAQPHPPSGDDGGAMDWLPPSPEDDLDWGDGEPGADS